MYDLLLRQMIELAVLLPTTHKQLGNVAAEGSML